MKVHFGTAAPLAQDKATGEMAPALDGASTVVTAARQRGGDGEYLNTYRVGTTGAEVKDHLFANPGMVTHLPDNTAVLSAYNAFRSVSAANPTWVDVEADEGDDPAEVEDYERFWSELFSCPRGRPDDVEATHWTRHNGVDFAPGETPPTAEELAAHDAQIRANAAAEQGASQ